MLKKFMVSLVALGGLAGVAIGGVSIVSASSPSRAITPAVQVVNSTTAAQTTATATPSHNCPHMGSSSGSSTSGAGPGI